MRSRPGYRSWFGGHVLGVVALCTSLLSYADAARAQADAGVQHAARVPAPPPPPAPPVPPAPAEPAPANGAEQPPGLKTLNPAQLSESVRARLQERTLGRHASNLPVPEVKPRHEAPNEPLRRGLARQRRVQAVETAEGVTVISNRLELPEPRLASMAMRQAKPVEVAPEEEHELEVANASHPESVTETHSLRAMSARTAKARLDTGTGLGWLIWPFVLFVTTGAIVGTLWFRKKTS